MSVTVLAGGRSLFRFLPSAFEPLRWFLTLEGGQDHDEISSFKFRRQFDLSPLLRLLRNSAQHVSSQVGVGKLSSSENDGHLGLVSLLQESFDMTKLELEIVFLGLRPQFHFFEMDDDLLLFRLMRLLALLIFELSVVHDAADGRLRFRRYLYQV